MKRATLIALAALLAFAAPEASALPTAQAMEITDQEETGPASGDFDDAVQKKKAKRKSKLTPEEAERRKKEKKAQNRKMESCLVLTRAFYVQHQKTFDSFIKEHSATHPETFLNPELMQEGAEQMRDAFLKKAEAVAKQNGNILLSKLNVNMMQKCLDKIVDEQIKELQKFKKAAPASFDVLSKYKDFAPLVDIEFSQYNWDDADVHRAQMALTQGPENEAYVKFEATENMLLSQIEDVNDSLSRDMQADQQKSSMSQGVTIPFMNPESGAGQALYLLTIFSALFGGLYWFYHILVLSPQQQEEERLKKYEARKAKKAKKAN